MRISVKGDILSLAKPATPWLTQFAKFDKFDPSELKSVILGKDVLGELGAKPARKLVVFGVSSIESCFGYHIARGPDSPTHPDQAALTVARSVLNAMESFLWKCELTLFPHSWRSLIGRLHHSHSRSWISLWCINWPRSRIWISLLLSLQITGLVCCIRSSRETYRSVGIGRDRN
jgi:hypothetical protein